MLEYRFPHTSHFVDELFGNRRETTQFETNVNDREDIELEIILFSELFQIELRSHKHV